MVEIYWYCHFGQDIMTAIGHVVQVVILYQTNIDKILQLVVSEMIEI